MENGEDQVVKGHVQVSRLHFGAYQLHAGASDKRQTGPRSLPRALLYPGSCYYTCGHSGTSYRRASLPVLRPISGPGGARRSRCCTDSH